MDNGRGKRAHFPAGGAGLSDRNAILLIVLLSLAAYGRTLMPGRIMSSVELLRASYPWKATGPAEPARAIDPVFVDFTVAFNPWLIHASREVGRGRLPLWNPHAFCGAPFAGAMQTAIFSPFTALAYLLPVNTAIGLACVLKALVAGLSMYWFLRLLALVPLSSLLGAVAFMFSGPVTVWMGWPLGAAAVWMPALFAGVELIRRDGTPRSAVPLALCVALQFLAGHPETSLHTISAAAAYAVVRSAGTARRRSLALTAGAFAAGAVLAGIQILPFLDYLTSSVAYEWRNFAPVNVTQPIKGTVLFLIPRFFGNRGAGGAWDEWFSLDPNEVSGTVGLVPLVLLPSALTRRGEFPVPFFTVLGLLAFAMVYKVPFLPLQGILAGFPVFSMSINLRLILALAFSLCVLGAVGFNNLLSRATFAPWTRRLMLFWGAVLTGIAVGVTLHYRGEMAAKGAWDWIAPRAGGAILMLLVSTALGWRLAGGRGKKLLPALLMGLQLLSTLPFAGAYAPMTGMASFYPETPALAFLGRNAGLDRVLARFPNILQVYGLHEPTGYDGMNPKAVALLLGSYDRPEEQGSDPTLFKRGFDSPVLDLTGVKYLLLLPGQAPPGERFRTVYSGPDGTVFLNSGALPRAFLAARARAFRDRQEELDSIVAGRVDLLNEVTLVPDGPLPPDAPKAGGDARIREYEPGRVVVGTVADAPAWLVLTDTWDSGWRGTVDGKPARVLRADHAFRAVRVPAGKHEVTFRYSPLSFRLGLLLTALGLILVVFAAVRGEAGYRNNRGR